jgi:hypothetical protein
MAAETLNHLHQELVCLTMKVHHQGNQHMMQQMTQPEDFVCFVKQLFAELCVCVCVL